MATSISKYEDERGRTIIGVVQPVMDVVEALAEAFHVDLHELVAAETVELELTLGGDMKPGTFTLSWKSGGAVL